MALIKTIAELQKFIKVSFTYSEIKALPNIQLAEDRQIKPIIGANVYATLQDQVDGNEILWTDLYNCICRVSAPLSVLSDLALRHIKLSDSGLKKTSSETQENVFKWEYMEVKDQLLEAAAIALDELWQHLYANGDEYDWEDPTDYQLAITTAKEFSQCYALHQPYRVFPLLQPIIKTVEKLFIVGGIGKTFLQELKEIDSADLVIAEEDTDAQEAIKKTKAEVLDLLKLAIAHFTIHKAYSKLPVKITDKGLTVIYEADSDKPESGEKTAGAAEQDKIARDAMNDGRMYMGQLKKLLNDNASADLFKTYYESDLYIAPGTVKANVNDSMTGIVGL
jgi:hypothetical protein